MKKMKFMLFAAAIVAAASCAKEIAPENNSGNTPDLNLIPMTFSAGSEETGEGSEQMAPAGAATKVTLQSNGKSLHWESTDQIKVFDGTETDLPAFTTTGSGASVDFTGGVADAEAGTYYALYPYQASASYGATAQENKGYGNVIKATIPAVQKAVANGIDSDAFVAAAKSENGNGYFKFKTVCGFIKFQLSEADATNAVAVSLSGNNLGAITGDIEIYFQKLNDSGETVEAFGQTYVSNKNKDYVTLTGTFQPNADYYFAIRENEFAQGFTMTILYADGSCKYAYTDQKPSKKVSRNSVMNIGTPAFEAGLPSNPYIAWQHGLKINIAGSEYSKATNGEATLIKSATNIGTAGVYFVQPGFTATVNKNLASVILVGTSAEQRATISVTKAFKPAGSSAMAIANADVTYSNTNQLFQCTTNTDKVTFENSSFNNIQHTFLNGGDNYMIDKISIKDCEIQVVGSNNGSVYLYYSKNTSEHSLLNIVNCAFYYRLADGKTALTDFKLGQYGGGTLKDINITHNTFDCTAIPNAGLLKVTKISGTVNINNNLYHNVVGTGAHSNLLGLDTKTGEVLPTGGDITNNFFYKSDANNTYNLIINRNGLDALTKLGGPQPTLDAILGTNWNPADKDFSIAESVRYINSQDQTITVSTENIGVHR